MQNQAITQITSPIKAVKSSITFEGDKVDIALSLFSNSLLVIATQYNKIANILEGVCENAEDVQQNEQDDKLFDIVTHFGQRDNELNELLCRGVLEVCYNRRYLLEALKKQVPELQINEREVGNPFYGKSVMLMSAFKACGDEKIIPFQKAIIEEIKIMLLDLVQ